jgi:regulator of extracellular matrix RemA (YlzA/DUF370 family)
MGLIISADKKICIVNPDDAPEGFLKAYRR